jgi:DNA modification methylase
MSTTIYTGDCRRVLDFMFDENSADSFVCDPPYELTQARPGGRSEAMRGKVMGGFMGMEWDGTGVAFDPATWAACLRVAKPGAFLLAFGGARTYHRLVCAIEDAGWEIRDQIGWAFGSGFPKSHNGEWGGTALKPAWEPICVARKPLIGTVEQNWKAHGTGGLNIDGCRVETNENPNGGAYAKSSVKELATASAYALGANAGEFVQPVGRWPANLIHDGSDEVLAAFPQAPGQLADASDSADERETQNVYGAMRRGRGAEPSANSNNEGEVGFKMKPGARRLDTGSAARFFYCAKASKSDRNEGLEDAPDAVLARSCQAAAEAKRGNVVEQASGAFNKARTVKNNHPTVKPTALMRYLCRLVTPTGGACRRSVRRQRLHRQGGRPRRFPLRGYRTQSRLRRAGPRAHRRCGE